MGGWVEWGMEKVSYKELADVFFAVFLVDVGVRGQQEAFLGGALVDCAELGGRVVVLVAVEADADDGVFIR